MTARQLLLLLLLLACSGCERAGQPAIWRFAIEEPSGSVQDAYAQEFKRLIETRSAGRIQVKVYPYGTLGTSDQITELLYNGSLQLSMASPGHLGKLIPEVQALLLHFLFSDDESINRQALADPQLTARFNALYAAKGFRLLAMFSEGWQVWTTNRPIREPRDFVGLKFRVMTCPLLLTAYAAYGASPTPLPYSDVYSALQLSMIDGQVNPVFAIQEMSFHEVTSHMTFARQAPFISSAICNRAFYDELTEQERAWLNQAISDLDPYIDQVQRKLNRERLKTIRKDRPDMALLELSSAQRDVFRQASLPVREAFCRQTGQSGEALLATILQSVERARTLPRPEDES